MPYMSSEVILEQHGSTGRLTAPGRVIVRPCARPGVTALGEPSRAGGFPTRIQEAWPWVAMMGRLSRNFAG